MPNKKSNPPLVRCIQTPPVCYVYELVSFSEFTQQKKPIGACFYSEQAIYDYMLEHGLYRCVVYWMGAPEDWWIDGESAFKQ